MVGTSLMGDSICGAFFCIGKEKMKHNVLKNTPLYACFCLAILIAQVGYSVYSENIQINCKNAQKTFDKFSEM